MSVVLHTRAVTLVLAVYSIRRDLLAVWARECQDLAADGVNGQHRGCALPTPRPGRLSGAQCQPARRAGRRAHGRGCGVGRQPGQGAATAGPAAEVALAAIVAQRASGRRRGRAAPASPNLTKIHALARVYTPWAWPPYRAPLPLERSARCTLAGMS